MSTTAYDCISTILSNEDGTYLIFSEQGFKTTIHHHKDLVDQDTWRGIVAGIKGILPPKFPDEQWEEILRDILNIEEQVNP